MAIEATEELQKVFKTLSDPTRIRILRLLEQEELVVQELMDVLGMAQSRVSRHLAILREAGLLEDRRDGTYVSYRFAPPTAGAWAGAWQLVRGNLEGDPTSERDDAILRRVIAARERGGRSFFDAVGPEWDALRQVFGDDVLRARGIARLVPAGLSVVDVGTGTGVLAIELAELGLDVIGIDTSARMLETARKKVAAHPPMTGRVRFERCDAHQLPLDTASVDGAFAHMVLHSLDEPKQAVAEMARVLRPGGLCVLCDFVLHGHEWMRKQLGVRWLGFEPATLEEWLSGAGLVDVSIQQTSPDTRDRDLPDTFIASARKPGPGA